MLYHLSLWAKPVISWLNVVHYVSFRCIAALLSSLLFSFMLGRWFITTSRRYFRSQVREWTPERHQEKNDMPTMGGIFIILVVVLNTLLWCNLGNRYVWIFLGTFVGFGMIGLIDDLQKIHKKRGIAAFIKFLLQVTIAGGAACSLLASGFSTQLCVPFVKWFNPDIGWWYIPWIIFLLVGCSNAVNLTDGLDGLAITSLLPNFALFSALCYVAGHYQIAHYLHIPFAASAEVAIIGATLVGASLGFLWYNTYPAHIFMGDVGSLSLGAGLALLAIMCKQELLLAVSGGLFVIETCSVIIQVISYKMYGRKFFRMAPIHHHFELLGWEESHITVRFGIISLILCLLALITIKIR